MSLVPVNVAEAEALTARAPEGHDIEVTVRRRRSNLMHSLYWARLASLIESGACGKVHDVETLHTLIKFELGYVQPVLDLKGKIRLLPRSIAFDKMGQHEFQAFFEAAMAAIAEHYHVNVEEL